MMSSRIGSRLSSGLERCLKARPIQGTVHSKPQQRNLSTLAAGSKSGKWEKPVTLVVAGGIVVAASIGSSSGFLKSDTVTTSLEAFRTIPLGPVVEDPAVVEPITETKPDDSIVEEPVTGITFPRVFQSKQLLGVGVRKKYHFVNVYAMAVYVNPDNFRGLKEDEYEKALLNPENNHTLRIIMNRTIKMETVIAAMLEAVEPRMHGKELYALEHFAKLRNYGALNKGDDIILTIRGDSVECACSNGGHNITTSKVFAGATLDVYFGKKEISPTVKASVLAGLDEL